MPNNSYLSNVDKPEQTVVRRLPGRYTAIASVLLAIAAISGIAFAYSNQIQNNLLKSRDLLLDQRNNLNRAYTETGNKIAELQRQQNTIRLYLQDNDRSLRDVDYALRSNPK